MKKFLGAGLVLLLVAGIGAGYLAHESGKSSEKG